MQCSFDRSSMLTLVSAVPRMCSSQIRDMFYASITHSVHTIWLARTACHFSSEISTLHGAKAKIISYVALSGNLSSRKCFPIPIDSRLLNVFLVSPHHRNFVAIVTVTWKPPTLPYVKVNTYGSVIGDSAACGGIFRDCIDSFLGCFACKLYAQTIFETGLYDFVFAIEYALMHRCQYLWVERDS